MFRGRASEFCVIADVFGWLPSQIQELTLPQYILFRDYAFNKIGIRDLIDRNSLTNRYRDVKSPVIESELKKIDKKLEAKEKVENIYNKIDNLQRAKESLIKKTGRKEFKMEEILKEVQRLAKISSGGKDIRIK